MSQEISTNRKEKKAQRDAERHKAGKKRKHVEVEQEDGEAQTSVLQADFIPLDTVADDVTEGGEHAPTKSKKRKAEIDPTEHSNHEAPNATTSKPKKRRKKNKSATQTGENGEAAPPAKHRFVCFIGNLPFTTTDASLQAHFKKLAPFHLRHRTDPQTKKSKGFAFLEFEKYDRMKTCLKLYHHSMFDPATAEEKDGVIEMDTTGEREAPRGRGQPKGARRINVELTAGGGGKTAARVDKIKAKNVLLDEQRQRRAEAEKEQKAKKALKAEEKADGEVKGDGRKNFAGREPQNSGKGGMKAKSGPAAAVIAGDESTGLHPSRLAMLQT